MRRNVSIITIICLILTGLLSYCNQSYALSIYKEVTKYHLDLGVVHIWSSDNGSTWQNGLTYNTTQSFSTSLTFGEDIKSVKAYVLNDAFNWTNDSTYSFNPIENYLKGQSTYEKNYAPYASNNISNIRVTLNDARTVNLTYSAKLKSANDFSLSQQLNSGGFDFIINLLGGEGAVKQELYEKLYAGKNGVGTGVVGYMFFIPIEIEYTVLEQVTLNIGDFTADLDVPTSAKPSESFNVVDKSAFYNNSEFACTQLFYSVDGGAEKQVTGWKGTSLGESIKQSFVSECTVKYRIATWNKYGDTKTASKTVNITNDHKIEINPKLTLPEYTYEGHTEIAKDESTFVVDGVNYSASRAHAEGIADNRFKADSITVSLSSLTDIKENCTFSKRGTYNIDLNISADGGGRATDSKSIEVRKTPYIEDSLTGFQKQNRKQILTATVATYPGKPLTDYSVTLKDKKTGESVVLTQDKPQQNTSAIKTRAVTMTQDVGKGFAYITVEFLTKTPSYSSTGTNTQDFYYQVDVTDSKGDTDTASKAFDVSPDLPPTAAISMDTAFLRNEGTNIATIKAEDVTVAKDGDSVERKWYYGATTAPSIYTDVSTMDGYSKFSFGTDKIVGFNTVGVGKFTTKLNVKEVWTEPTLEEYVTDADHLTGGTVSYSDVQNVAPVVSLKLLSGTEKKVLLLAKNDTEYQTILNNKTALKQSLLANKIDADIVIKKLIGDTPSDVIAIQKKLTYQFPTAIWSGSGETDRVTMASDSEKTYFTTWAMPNTSSFTVPVTIHAYDPYKGEVWSYSSMKDEMFSFSQDDIGKYLYVVYSNQTVLLDKRTGAIAGTINMPLSSESKIIITDNLIFITESGTLYAIDQASLTKTKIDTGVSAASRVGGNIEYITKGDDGVIKNTLNVTSLTITKEVLADTSRGLGSSQDYRAVIIDSTGKVALFKAKGTGTDTFHGIRVYSSDNTLIKEITAGIEVDNYYKLSAIYGSQDENGECHRVIIHEVDTDTKPDTHYFTGINLDNGIVAQYGQRSSDFGMMDFTQLDSNGKFYLYGSGWYVNGGTDYWGPCATLVFDGAQMRFVTGSGTIGNADEGFSASDRMIVAWFGDNSKGTLDLKISVFPKTLIQETKEIIAKFADKLTFVGDVNTSADQIKATVDAPKPVTKITATQNGYLSLCNQSLAENKKYYYEYDIKPLTEGTENSLNGLKASTVTSMSGQPFSSDTYYVKNTYKEDFNDSITNSFFTVGSGIWSRFGAFGANYDSKYENTNDAPITFTVPAGCVAVLSFDYDIYYLSSGHLESAVYIDGERFYTDAAPDANATGETYNNKVWNHYTHFKLLYPGTHTLTCHRYTRNNTASTYIDNLKVEILSPTKPSLAASFNAQSDEGGWISADGTFETPNGNISYGSQVSSYYSGGIPGGVVDYFSPKKYGTMYPSRGEYYQTVPSGYLQKGWCYPYASCYSDDTVEFSIAGYPYKIGEEGTISSGAKTYLRTMPEGTYAHTYKNDAKGNSSWINQWDLITYPNNSQTITGNISFNSSFTEYFFPKESSTGLTNLSVYLPKGEYLLKNFKIYYYENGEKVYLQNEDCQEITDISKWTLSSGLSASIAAQTEEKTDDEYVKVYKKGEKVLYNIFYDDYEKDPSKTGYWVYSHINWPPDTVHPDVGKILTAPIDRFYLSGKYTVTHWEVDNTQRTGTAGDATPYNKESNKVTMTFYVDGEGKAPWITYIKTNPLTVEYDDSYSIRVGVDDSEKDTLALETSVYLNGTLIKTDNKTGIIADSDGNYPEQSITGLPKAKKGTYQVVCTVSDYSGTGIKSYKFNVIGVSASSSVNATSSLKSGYGISATVKTVTENCKAASVVALLPSGSKVSMVCTAGSGDNLTWQFPANTGTYANLYNKKFNTVSRQIFVPVKWPDDSYYNITYYVYDSNGGLLTQTSSKTYVDGNMYDDDYTVKTE